MYLRVRMIKSASIFPELSETEELCKLLVISPFLSLSLSLSLSLLRRAKLVRKQQKRKRSEGFIVCEYLLVSQRCGNDTSCIEFAGQTVKIRRVSQELYPPIAGRWLTYCMIRIAFHLYFCIARSFFYDKSHESAYYTDEIRF